VPLTLSPVLLDAGIYPASALVIRHAYVREHEDSGLPGIHADSTDAEIIAYTRNQSADTKRFPAVPARYWVVFIKEGGDQARLWSVVENRGEVSNASSTWPSPSTWQTCGADWLSGGGHRAPGG